MLNHGVSRCVFGSTARLLWSQRTTSILEPVGNDFIQDRQSLVAVYHYLHSVASSLLLEGTAAQRSICAFRAARSILPRLRALHPAESEADERQSEGLRVGKVSE